MEEDSTHKKLTRAYGTQVVDTSIITKFLKSTV